ncbi:ribonuclease H-like domain-containing protein [Tanacetum coccineum]|uniref:Ribonuclease H-like domain-containing protein n=1 Tax=Tanacetum coccineum TaxID=301880 RepID=A0ABQ5CQ89_9ASTR
MAAPGHSNVVARHAIDEIAEFTSETKTPKYMKVFILQQIAKSMCYVRVLHEEADIARRCLAQVNAMIAKMEAMNDQEEYYNSLRSLRDNRRIGNDRLMRLNELIAQAEEDIWTNESHLEIMEAAIKVYLFCVKLVSTLATMDVRAMILPEDRQALVVMRLSLAKNVAFNVVNEKIMLGLLKLITITADTKVLKAMQIMTDNRIRHIPVIGQRGMLGMDSIGDVVRAITPMMTLKKILTRNKRLSDSRFQMASQRLRKE